MISKFRKMSFWAAGLVSVIGAGGFAYAATQMENDGIPPTPAKIQLIQAVSAAELHANGKAVRAEYEKTKQGWVYDVEIVSGPKVFDVRVDADKGTVIASTEDKADRDDDHDKRD